MRHAVGGLAAAALAASILVWPAGPVHANGTFVNHPDVRIFTPTPLAHDSAAPAPVVVQPVEVVVHVLLDALALDRGYRRALAREHRKDRLLRVFGHRYTGFIRMYRGLRYPF